jgi:hypothetical protein
MDSHLGVSSVMPGLVPGIHVSPLLPVDRLRTRDVDGRDKPGHDALQGFAS